MASLSHRRRFTRTLLAAGIFLCMQIAAVTHAATYGDATHSHNGTPCAIQLLSTGPATPATECTFLPDPRSFDRVLARDYICVTPVNLDHSHAIRAPPFLAY